MKSIGGSIVLIVCIYLITKETIAQTPSLPPLPTIDKGTVATASSPLASNATADTNTRNVTFKPTPISVIPPNVSYSTLLNVPAVQDFLGCGFDIRWQSTLDAIRPPLFEWHYSYGKRYSYPTKRDSIFKLPDEVLVRNLGKTESRISIHHSTQDLTDTILVNIGVNYTTASNQSSYLNNSTRCVQQRSATINSTAEAKSPAKNTTDKVCYNTRDKKRAMSLGVNVEIQNYAFQQHNSHLVINSENTRLFNVYLDSAAALSFRDLLKNDLNALATADVTVDARPFFAFFERWGTHYVSSASVGGQVRMNSLVESSFDGNNFNIGIGGNFQISDADAVNSAKYSFSNLLSAHLDFGYEKKTKNTQKASSNSWTLIGGDQLGVDLLDAVDTAATIMEWKQTITRKPLPIDYKVKEIPTLITDLQLRKQMTTALDVFLTVPTDDIVRVSSESVFDRY